MGSKFREQEKTRETDKAPSLTHMQNLSLFDLQLSLFFVLFYYYFFFYLQVVSRLISHFHYSTSVLQLLSIVNISFFGYIISFNILSSLITPQSSLVEYCLRIFHDTSFNSYGCDWNTMLTTLILQKPCMEGHVHSLCSCKFKNDKKIILVSSCKS